MVALWGLDPIIRVLLQPQQEGVYENEAERKHENDKQKSGKYGATGRRKNMICKQTVKKRAKWPPSMQMKYLGPFKSVKVREWLGMEFDLYVSAVFLQDMQEGGFSRLCFTYGNTLCYTYCFPNKSSDILIRPNKSTGVYHDG